MSRSLWKRALFGMAGVGLSGALVVMSSQAQPTIITPPAASTAAPERHVTLYENGKSIRCRLVHTWKLPDGSTAHQLAAISDGESITLIEEGTTTRVDGKEARPTRIYHWGPGATRPPAGVPTFPGAGPSTISIAANAPKLPGVATIPVTSGGPRVVDPPNLPPIDTPPATITSNTGPRMVDTPKTSASPAAPAPTANVALPPITTTDAVPIASPPSLPVMPPTTEGPVMTEPFVPAPSASTSSRLFQKRATKTASSSSCPTCTETEGTALKKGTTCNGHCSPGSGCPTCAPPPALPFGATSSTAPASNARRPLFGGKNTTPSAPSIASAGKNPAGENIIMVTDPSNGQPPMPILAGTKQETPRPIMQRLFNKPADTTEPKPVLESVREPFSTAMDPSVIKKEVRKPIMPRMDVAPKTAAEFPQPPSEKDTKPSTEKRDWRMSWGRNESAKGEVPGQSTLEKSKTPLASLTEKSKTDPLLNPDRPVKPAPDLPTATASAKQPLPSGIGSVMAAGGPNGQPTFIPVPIATVPNVTRYPQPPPLQLPGAPPGPPSVNMPQPPNNPWANNAFTQAAPMAGQAPGAMNAFVAPPPPPVQQPAMPGNAFGVPMQQPPQQAYYPQPGYYPQAAYYPQPQAGYYPMPMPQPGYAYQAAYQPQPGYPVAPVGYQMGQGQMPNPAMDRQAVRPETQSVSQLVQTLNDSPFPAQREVAVVTLASYDHRKEPQILQALCTAAKQDPAATVRARAVYCLSRLGITGEPVSSILQTLRTDNDVRVRQEVEEAYQRLGIK